MSVGQLCQPLLTATPWFTWSVWFLDFIAIFALNSGGSYTGCRMLEIRFLLLFFFMEGVPVIASLWVLLGMSELMSSCVLNKVSLSGTVAWWEQHGERVSFFLPCWWVTIPRNRYWSWVTIPNRYHTQEQCYLAHVYLCGCRICIFQLGWELCECMVCPLKCPCILTSRV